jgi:hypothetical protein
MLVLAIPGRGGALDAGEAAVTAAASLSGGAIGSAEIVERYVSAVQSQKRRPVTMEVDFDARLPRLGKEGRLHAFRFITRLGQTIYRLGRYDGDNMVKKEVIARYLEAEKRAKSEYTSELAITPANYKFKYKGTTDYAGRPAYVFQVSPKKSRVGLFKGEIWIDEATYLPLREWGELVKNPSVFLKRVYFVRDYFIYEGNSVPRRLISNVDTRLVGKAQLTVWFDKFDWSGDGEAAAAASAAGAGPELAAAGGARN